MQRKLAEAIDVITKCERVFADPEKAARRGNDLAAQYAVEDFMAAHRAERENGGQL
jgi:hypothetical protein